MPERILLIVNPAATRVRGHLRRAVRRHLDEVGDVEEVETGPRTRAGQLAEAAVASGATTVVALGGDGTVNETAGTLAGTDVALVPIAGGGTNVFARAMGWPHPASAAIDLIGPAFASGAIRTVRLGRVTADSLSRVFCVNAGVGIDANTVQRVEAHPWLKQHLRQMSFGIVTVAEAVRSVHRQPCITMRADGGDPLELATLIVAAGSPWAFLGPRPLELTPGAAFDGRLRWLGLEELGPRNLTMVVRGALRSGSHIGREGIHDGWASDRIVLSVDHPVALQADGEPLGRFSQITFTPGPSLRVLVPPS